MIRRQTANTDREVVRFIKIDNWLAAYTAAQFYCFYIILYGSFWILHDDCSVVLIVHWEIANSPEVKFTDKQPVMMHYIYLQSTNTTLFVLCYLVIPYLNCYRIRNMLNVCFHHSYSIVFVVLYWSVTVPIFALGCSFTVRLHYCTVVQL